MVEAVLTRSLRSKKRMTQIMNAEVESMDMTGVLVLGWILLKKAGRRLSELIAIGDREAERIPALAVVMKAIRAAPERIIRPGVPINDCAASEIGVRLLLRVASFRTPTVILTIIM